MEDNIDVDLHNKKYCFHCGLGGESKKRLKSIDEAASENVAMSECFRLKCVNGYMCNNCCNVLINLHKKFVNFKNRLELVIRNLSVGNLTPTKIPVRRRQTSDECIAPAATHSVADTGLPIANTKTEKTPC